MEAPKTPICLFLDNVRSAYNVGSIFRTADAFRLEKIYLGGYTARPPHNEILKTALGSTESVDWEGVEKRIEKLKQLSHAGYKILGIEQTDDSLDLDEFKVSKNEKYVLVFGNEAFGVEEDILALCDSKLEIPQFGTKHSLNVAVSLGVVLWHFHIGSRA